MLAIILTLLVVAVIVGLLFGPDAWGYANVRSPIVLILVLVFHPF